MVEIDNTTSSDIVTRAIDPAHGKTQLPASSPSQQDYDFVFVTHLPSFYKVNLYEKLAERGRLLAIFVGATSTARTPDFVANPAAFDHVFLSSGSFERRPKLLTLWRLWRLLRTVRSRTLFVGGWDLPEFWVGLLAARCTRGMVMETTGLGVEPSGVKSAIKRLALSLTDVVMASGNMHADFVRRLGFRGRVFVTRGVGIINKHSAPPTARGYGKQFLYVGRIAPEKNIDFLFSLFRRLAPDGFGLTVAGGDRVCRDGNIHHVGYQPNERLPSLLAEHDFLILPSLSEPWGLVVEESLFCGTPVILSKACGASELIEPGGNGLFLDTTSIEAAALQLLGIDADTARSMRAACGPAMIDAKDAGQTFSYVEALNAVSPQPPS
jgi:glycosyltransferase involved in cell wall biosynthesis